MPNVIDYLDWRGDIDFDISGFNSIDNLIVSLIAYMDLTGIVSDDFSDKPVKLKDAAKKFFDNHQDKKLSMGLIVPYDIITTFKKAAQSRRFENMGLCGYVRRIDTSSQKQFAAVTAVLPDRTKYIAYCGTDDTLVGWKENFNMSFLSEVPAQKDAVDYLSAAASAGIRYKLRVGGHSKGGNLAVYAAIYASEKIKKRIIGVYDNDGPGFRENITNSNEYKSISDRIKTFVPQMSIVGMLLEHTEKYQVVRSTQKGIMQHDGLSWQVLGTDFIYDECLAPGSKKIEQILRKWIYGMEPDQREQLVEALYDILSATGATTLTELTGEKMNLLKSYIKLSGKEKDVISKGMKQLLRDLLDNVRKKPEAPAAAETRMLNDGTQNTAL